MPTDIVLLPTDQEVGLSSIRIGLKHVLQQEGYLVSNFNPLLDAELTPDGIKNFFIEKRINDYFSHVFTIYNKCIPESHIALIDGLYITHHLHSDFQWLNTYTRIFNQKIINLFNTHVILVAHQGAKSLTELENKIQLTTQKFTNMKTLGVIINNINAPTDPTGTACSTLISKPKLLTKPNWHEKDIEQLDIFRTNKIKLIGVIPWESELTYPRTLDIKHMLKLNNLNKNSDFQRRIKHIILCVGTIDSVFAEIKPNALILTPADRHDMILAACFSVLNGVKLAGLVLTSFTQENRKALGFFLQNSKLKDLPVLSTPHNLTSILLKLKEIDYLSASEDDLTHIDIIKRSISKHVNIPYIINKLNHPIEKKQSPSAFMYYLVKRANKIKAKIVLPEGEDSRIIEAAIYCHQHHIADCILLGVYKRIEQTATSHGLQLLNEITIIDPEDIKQRYVKPLIEKRAYKGMTEILAIDSLNDPITLATMMVEQGDANGMVAGTINTTAHILSQALKLIKTKNNYTIASSVFFMCLEDRVLLYADCAVNPDPSAEQLAEIAIQSAESAKQFGIEPIVAMLSYSTGTSGRGIDIEKVRQAALLVKQGNPNIPIDGPLQYDAATELSIAQKKAPGSLIAGHANVLIFPDLNTGNTTYKAVQQSAHVLSIGPIIQGLNKPVNDLSRGATIDDIIYTIAITAIQAE